MSFRAADTVSGSSGGRPGDRPRFRAARDTVAGTFRDQPAFEVRDHAEDMEHKLAGGRGGLEALLKADQVDPTGLEAVHGLEQLAQRTSQTVEAGDAQVVPGPSVIDELGEAEPT